MNDPLPITPLRQPLNAQLQLPGSKSITNRALILAALAKGETHLEGALFSRDTQIMLEALKTLGFKCASDSSSPSITVHGEGGTIPNNTATLHVGNAGTAARFLAAFLALHPNGTYALDGDPAYAPIAQKWLLGKSGSDSPTTRRASGAVDNLEFFKAGVPHECR